MTGCKKLPCETDTVHIIEPDEAIRHRLSELLATVDVRVLCYPDAESFLGQHALQDLDHGCLLVDEQLPGLGAVPLLRQLDTMGVDLPVIVLASSPEKDTAQMALAAGAAYVLDKPLVNRQLLNGSQHLLKRTPGLSAGAPRQFRTRNGTEVTIRAIAPNDAEIEQLFVRALSDRSRYRRFFSGINQLSPYMLEKFTHPRYPRNWALIATILGPEGETQIGVARYAPTQIESSAEFAIVVADDWQGLGIATQLLRELIAVADSAGIETLEGLVLRDNVAMLELTLELGFTVERDPDDATVVRVVRRLLNPQEPTTHRDALWARNGFDEQVVNALEASTRESSA